MKELSEEELLEWLNLVFGKGFDVYILSEDYAEDNERSEQAYQQIRKLIEEKSILRIPMTSVQSVSKEFVEKWAKQSLFIPAEKSKSRLIEMLQEAGVEVEDA